MRVEVRKGTLEDIDYILSELKGFAKFYGTKKSLFGDDFDYMKATMSNIITNGVVFLAWRGEVRMGFIIGLSIPHPWNPKIKLLAESFWWVEEQYRMSRAGLMLLDRFTEWGNDNVDWITFSLEHHSPVKDTCLLRRGYKLQEYNYLREV